MKKLLRYPFICLLVLSIVIAMPFMWKQIADSTSGKELSDPDDPVMEDMEDIKTPDEPTSEDPVSPTEDPVTPPEDPTAPSTNPDENPEKGDTAEETTTPEVPEVPDVPADPPAPVKPVLDPNAPLENSLFIGDSRTVGLANFSGESGAKFYAFTGMSVYSMFKKESAVDNWGDKLLETVLTENQFDRVFLMVGINELGYNFNTTVQRYGEAVAKIRELQPNAILILEANLHVGSSRSNKDSTINNTAINRLNEAQSQYADNDWIFYMDVNPLFDDAQGALGADYSSDATHPYGKYYANWIQWIRDNLPA